MPIIQSVERALQILDLFNDHTTELKITEISDQMGLHKSTVHSLLKTLQASRYMDQNPENGKYRLGLKLVERGNLVINTLNIRQIANKYLVVYVWENGSSFNKIGISCSKKVGNSVVRHRFARLVRESYRLQENVFNSGLDIVVVARACARDASFFDIQDSLISLAGKARIIKNGGNL